MTLTTAQQVRLRIQDQPATFDRAGVGDGLTTVFDVPYRNITSGTAYIQTAGAWAATGATIDASGFVMFSGVISANSAWRVRGVYSTFSDDEIGHFTAVGGSVDGAALEAVETLMFDSLKRAKWAAPDGTQWDDTAAMDQLNKMWTALRVKLDSEYVQGGGFVSWPMGQTGL